LRWPMEELFFLDEIGELPYSLQAKFLHVIQEKEYIPIGGTNPVPTDFA
jgi:Transcriptional regulator containing PAS, AAA-type ATPase, and DNA-binding domains